FFTFTSCNKDSGSSGAAAPTDETYSDPPKFSELKTNIFQPICTTCHAMFASQATLMASGTVVASDSANSRLYQKVFSGEMPKDQDDLPAADIEAIKDWIDNGALDN